MARLNRKKQLKKSRIKINRLTKKARIVAHDIVVVFQELWDI